ncbi:AAA family ATPase [Yinghuangia sp. ASG 101]|uniref:helix-hairpin-helix domain-containing protein n=1 Tax=Yinghuangia sp. ASG 101 TaxID=2896848 RepID=UPI001E35568C|nr:helix-hairpin-helix domain-containing protein [Yinghuangia sp. ASG 101]UGQ10557.1 AAA family ATPase [Yinghuangia sp. ASG 101]
MNESGDGGMDGDTRSGGAEGTVRGGAAPSERPGDALAAARAALAALDKANSAGDAETSSREELAAAWQALTVLGQAQGSAGGTGPSAARRSAPGGSEWALPVVDAPPSRLDEPPTPVAAGGSRPGDGWALPVLDAPPSAARSGEAASGTEVAPPRRPREPREADAERRAAPPATAPDGAREASRRTLAGDPDAAWAAPVLDAPPAAEPEVPRADAVPGGSADAPPFAPRRPEGAHHAAGFAADSSGPDAEAEPDAADVDAVREVLAAGGAPVRLAEQALVALGPDAADLLRENPWNLLALPGLSPQQADLFAQGTVGGPDPDDPRRTQALITRHLHRAAGHGHTAVGAPSVVGALEQAGVRDAFGALRAAYDNGRIMAFAERPAAGDDVDSAVADENDDATDAFDEPGAFDDGFGHPFDSPADHLTVALERHALAEESIAEAVLRLLSTVAPPPETAVPSPALPESGVVLHVPGAGEDPPSAPLALARALGPRAVVVCPTADGASRVRDFLTAVGDGDGGPVVTTPRGLFGDRGGPARGVDGLLDTDLLVVRDAHLLDVQSAAAVLESVPDGARVVLCGDPDELQPAAPGRVFADLRESGVVPVVVSSEQGPGVLGQLVSAVRAGSLPPVESPDRQVVLVGVRGAAEAVHRCVQLVADSIPRALGIPSDDVLVVTPAEGGGAGATALNAALKERLNPGPGRYAGFDIGDRVVRVPGPRAEAPAEGRVVDAVPDGLAVVFRDAPDRPETVPRARLGELRHGWAVTVRQALGTRRPGVVAVLPGDAGDLVTRALVYTAFTRARRHLSVVYPADGTLPRAVARTPESIRTTRLVAAVREAADQMLGSPEEPTDAT